MGKITIVSDCFNNRFLRMDGEDISPSGGGTVNCQYGAQTYERFELIGQADGTFAIASIKFPGVYLRMDSNGVVKSQFGVGLYEKFYVVPQGGGTVAFVSQARVQAAQNPANWYLRMDGSAITQFALHGGGEVNYATSVGPYEKFRINLI
jgi:hypothetical protein